MILKSPPSKTVIVEIELPDTGESYNELVAQLNRLEFTYTITPDLLDMLEGNDECDATESDIY